MKIISLACFLLACIALAGCGIVSPELTPFYDPPDPLPPGEPGEIIKTEKIETGSADVQAWRVMYHSRDLNGNDTAVTGLFAAPTSPAPEGGYPLLAIAHGTGGLARKCATSLDPWSLPPLAGDYLSFPDSTIVPYVKAGYAVTATDYEGLGAPGDSSFLVGTVEAQNVLDSIRALRHFDGVALNDQNFIWGHSQGGHSIAFTAQLAQEIAPKIGLNGIVLGAPAIELQSLVQNVFVPNVPSPVTGVAAMVAASWNQAYDLPLDSVLTAEGIKLMPTMLNDCILGAIAASALQKPDTYYFADPTTTSPWSDTMVLNTPKTMLYPAPVMVVQGEADPVIAAQTTRASVERLCSAGNHVLLNLYKDVDHWGVVKASNADVLEWLKELEQGDAAPNNCPKPDAKAAPPATPMNPTLQPPVDGVILADGAFTPDAKTIAELESLLPNFLAQNQAKFSAQKAPIVERLPNYKRQYWGELQNGKQAIFLNALCTEIENWRTQRVFVLDGGDCFFTVLYDPATKTFSELSVNGEA